jgi:hypothetical protein
MPVHEVTADLEGRASHYATCRHLIGEPLPMDMGMRSSQSFIRACRAGDAVAAIQNLVEVSPSLIHHARMKLVSLVTFLGVAFLTSASVAAHHGISNTTAPATNVQPEKMACTILDAWTASGERVDPSIVNLTGAANLKDMGIGVPCGNSGSDCAPAVNVTNGVPLYARVSGC